MVAWYGVRYTTVRTAAMRDDPDPEVFSKTVTTFVISYKTVKIVSLYIILYISSILVTTTIVSLVKSPLRVLRQSATNLLVMRLCHSNVDDPKLVSIVDDSIDHVSFAW